MVEVLHCGNGMRRLYEIEWDMPNISRPRHMPMYSPTTKESRDPGTCGEPCLGLSTANRVEPIAPPATE